MSKPPPMKRRHGAQRSEKRKTTVIDARDAVDAATSSPAIRESGKIDTADAPETCFAGQKAVRGKYHKRVSAASGLVRLDPDVREAFADAEAVNQALRQLVKIAKQIGD